MAVTPDSRTDEQRFAPEQAPPGGPQRGRPPDRGVAAFVLIAVVVVGALLATVIVLAAGGGDKSASSTPPQPTARPATTAPATPAAAARSIAVTLKEFTINPQPATGRAGRVTFHVRNGGTVTHEFVVLRTSKPAGALRKGTEASEAGNVGEVADLQPGANKTLKLKLRPGHYAFICNLPGHYLAGQHADFTVR